MSGPVLMHPTYFPNVAHGVLLYGGATVVFENEDHFQKQTLRNRAYICGANGKQSLVVPVKHAPGTGHRKYKDVRIEYAFDWQKNHQKTIETAYRSAAFYEFYEDLIRDFFKKRPAYLIDLNYGSIDLISSLLKVSLPKVKTDSYEEPAQGYNDYRHLVNCKTPTGYNHPPYYQLFSEKHGFLENLSLIDLIFNEGTRAIDYIKNQQVTGVW